MFRRRRIRAKAPGPRTANMAGSGTAAEVLTTSSIPMKSEFAPLHHPHGMSYLTFAP
jgi:hypothetical protein